MTRERVIEIHFANTERAFPRLSSERIREVVESEIDSWVDLGILKLEEPKSAREKFKDYLEKFCGWSGPGGIFRDALEAFDASQK